MIYNIILFACFCFALCEGIYAKTLLKTSTNVEINEKCEKLEKKLFIFVIAYMIFICGMRAYKGINYVGIDTRNYYTMYLLQKSLTFKDIINNGDFDIGYTLLSWLFIKLDWEFAAIILCAAIVFVGSVAVFIYKYSKNRFMSIFVFVAMGLYFFGFTAIRQTLAMGICVCAYMFAQKNTGFKSLVVFVLLVWLASTIHASAIVFFPAYILQKMPFKTSRVVTLLVVAALAMLFKNQVTDLLFRFASQTSEKYEIYTDVESGSVGMRLYLFVLMTVILRLIFFNSEKKPSENDNLIYMVQFMLILFPAVQSGGAVMRIYFYYYIFFVAYLPNMLESIDDIKTRRLAYLLLTYFLLFVYSGTNFAVSHLLPYQFFWQSV